MAPSFISLIHLLQFAFVLAARPNSPEELLQYPFTLAKSLLLSPIHLKRNITWKFLTMYRQW